MDSTDQWATDFLAVVGSLHEDEPARFTAHTSEEFAGSWPTSSQGAAAAA
ncbi:hypothetical protein [Streptomyces sp. NPDC101455]